MVKNFINNSLIPRIAFLPYYVARFTLYLLLPYHFLVRLKSNGKIDSSIIGIEAGINGWKSIEFKEIYQSALEYAGNNSVHRLVVDPDKNYCQQVKIFLSEKAFSHYVYDPRTGSQNWFIGMWQSIKIALLLQKHDVTPIVFLTDLALRRWRNQSAIVSAQKGVTVTFMSPKIMQPVFPHSRLVGPSLMPFSVHTCNKLVALAQEHKTENAIFTGSLYEPRTTILESINSALTLRGHTLKILGRDLGSSRVDDAEYWNRLYSSKIVVTTSLQYDQPGADWKHVPHLIYRFLEVLAAGSLLVANDVPGVSRYFSPGEHFIAFTTSEDAANQITHYLENDQERIKIARAGHLRAKNIIAARIFWVSIDSALGSNSIH